MNNLLAILKLESVPANINLGLLVLRLWLGLSIFKLHGWSKLTGFSGLAGKFPDPLGIGSHASLGLVVFAEFLCGLLVALGLLTRLAALVLVIELAVAFLLIHHAVLAMGPGSGELAFVYLAGFVALLIAGPGSYSLDARTGKRNY